MIVSFKFIAFLFVVSNISVHVLAQRTRGERPTTTREKQLSPENKNESSTDSNNEPILGQPLIPFTNPRRPTPVQNLFQLIFPALGMLLNWGSWLPSQSLLGSPMDPQIPQESSLVFVMPERIEGKKSRSRRQINLFQGARTNSEGMEDDDPDSLNLPILSQIFRRPLRGLSHSDNPVLGQSLEQQTPIGQILSQGWQDFQQRQQNLAQMLQTDLGQNPIQALGQSLRQTSSDLMQRNFHPRQAFMRSLRRATARRGLGPFLKPAAIAERLAKRFAQSPVLNLGHSLTHAFPGALGAKLGNSPARDTSQISERSWQTHSPWRLARSSSDEFYQQDEDNEVEDDYFSQNTAQPFGLENFFGGIKEKRDATSNQNDDQVADLSLTDSSDESDREQKPSETDSMLSEASQISEIHFQPVVSTMNKHGDDHNEKGRNYRSPADEISEMKFRADLHEILKQKDLPVLWFHRPSANIYDIQKNLQSRAIRQQTDENVFNPGDLEIEAKLDVFERKLIQELQQLQEIERQASELRAGEMKVNSSQNSPHKLKYTLSKTPVYKITRGDIEETLKDDLFQKLLHKKAQEVVFMPYGSERYNPQRSIDSIPAVESLTKEELVKMMAYALRQSRLTDKSSPLASRKDMTSAADGMPQNEVDKAREKVTSTSNAMGEDQQKLSETKLQQDQQDEKRDTNQPHQFLSHQQIPSFHHQSPKREFHPYQMIPQIPDYQWIDINEVMNSYNPENDIIARPLMMQSKQSQKMHPLPLEEINPFRKNGDTAMMIERQSRSRDNQHIPSSVSDNHKVMNDHHEIECNHCEDPKKREMLYAVTQYPTMINHRDTPTDHQKLQTRQSNGFPSIQAEMNFDRMTNPRPIEFNGFENNVEPLEDMPRQIPIEKSELMIQSQQQQQQQQQLLQQQQQQQHHHHQSVQQHSQYWDVSKQLNTEINAGNQHKMVAPHQPMNAVERQMDEIHHFQDNTDPMMMRIHEQNTFHGIEDDSPIVGASPQMLEHADLIRKGNLYGILRSNSNEPSAQTVEFNTNEQQQRTGHRRFPPGTSYNVDPNFHVNGGHYGSIYGGGAHGTNAYGSGLNSKYRNVVCKGGSGNGATICMEEQVKLTPTSQMTFQSDTTGGDREKQFRSQLASTNSPHNEQPVDAKTLTRLGRSNFNLQKPLDFRNDGKNLSKRENEKNREENNCVKDFMKLKQLKRDRCKRNAFASNSPNIWGSLKPIDKKLLNELRKTYKTSLTEITLRPDENPDKVLNDYNSKFIQGVLENIQSNPIRISNTKHEKRPEVLVVNENNNNDEFYSVNEKEMSPIVFGYNQDSYGSGKQNDTFMAAGVGHDYQNDYRGFPGNVQNMPRHPDYHDHHHNSQNQVDKFKTPEVANGIYNRNFYNQDHQNRDYQDDKILLKNTYDYRRRYGYIPEVVHKDQYQDAPEYLASKPIHHNNENKYKNLQDQHDHHSPKILPPNENYKANYGSEPGQYQGDQYIGIQNPNRVYKSRHHENPYHDRFLLNKDQQEQDQGQYYDHQYTHEGHQGQHRNQYNKAEADKNSGGVRQNFFPRDPSQFRSPQSNHQYASTISHTNDINHKLRSINKTHEVADNLNGIRNKHLEHEAPSFNVGTTLVPTKPKMCEYSSAVKEILPVLINRLLKDFLNSSNDDGKELNKTGKSWVEKCARCDGVNKIIGKKSNESSLSESIKTHHANANDFVRKMESTTTTKREIAPNNETELDFIKQIHKYVEEWLKQPSNNNGINQKKQKQEQKESHKFAREAKIAKQVDVDEKQIVDTVDADDPQRKKPMHLNEYESTTESFEESTKGYNHSVDRFVKQTENETVETSSFAPQESITLAAKNSLDAATTQSTFDLIATTQKTNYDNSVIESSKEKLEQFRHRELKETRESSRSARVY